MSKIKKSSSVKNDDDSLWKPDYFKIEVSSTIKEQLRHLLEKRLAIIPNTITSELAGGKTTKNNQVYYFFKELGLDYKILNQRKSQLEYHSSYFLHSSMDRIKYNIRQMTKNNLIVSILRLDLCIDLVDKKPLDLFKRASQAKFSCIIRRYPEDTNKPVESWYIIDKKFRWKIVIYDKTIDTKKKFKTFSMKKQTESQKYLDNQYTRIEIRLNKEILRENYMLACDLQDWNGIISHFFSRKKFTGPLSRILKGGKTKYRRSRKVKSHKQSEVNFRSLEKTLLLMSLNMNEKGLKELESLVNDKELIKRIRKNRDLVISENKKYEDFQQEVFGENLEKGCVFNTPAEISKKEDK